MIECLSVAAIEKAKVLSILVDSNLNNRGYDEKNKSSIIECIRVFIVSFSQLSVGLPQYDRSW